MSEKPASVTSVAVHATETQVEEDSSPVVAASAADLTEGRGSQHVQDENVEWIPRHLQAKAGKVCDDLKQWTLVPKPFLVLVAFCISFAVLSLTALLLLATTSDDSNDDSDSRDNSEMSSSFLLSVGVISSIVGSLQTASGYCAQRLSHQLAALLRRRHRTMKHHPLFYVGLLLLVCGTISAVVNLGILGQSVTAPFAAMTLIFNGCLAFSVLHEAVTKYDIIATVLVLVGVGVAMVGVSLADLGVQAFTLGDIEEIFTRSALPALYSMCMLGSLGLSFLVVNKKRLQSKPAGLCCFSIGAGVLSGFSSLCVKCTVEVLKSVSQDQHSGDLSDPVLYLFVVGIPVCVLSQLKLMTLGLQYFGTLKFVPPYHAFIILSNLVNGMVYFNESSGYDALSASLFVAGCGVTVAGVFVLLAKVPTTTKSEGDQGSTTQPALSKSANAERDEADSSCSTNSSDGDSDAMAAVRSQPIEKETSPPDDFIV